MLIIESKRFTDELNSICDFIAKDSINRAITFQQELKSKLDNIAFMPYINRKSIKFNDKNIRDFIFKGYVIPYLIDDDKIVILGIYKRNLWNK
ncbi:type II toxin-antitoxin system RelE/ParE family toxin [Campylobacter ureolyticus]|uniref:type II toxin-antitoxin system RelE/ParE family toxin n=1 Tax=Campylobacter ureolyticus TaxID=827 RepID=UPI0022B36190|nr:type II toxin-antitoxin system RelE/ParE family toxin [Campylobacter ureolyticus]MCZ6156858.1 type II toxin-antitoxin system RelE/ParE family toxin [Campylobacter ureolyticus]